MIRLHTETTRTNFHPFAFAFASASASASTSAHRGVLAVLTCAAFYAGACSSSNAVNGTGGSHGTGGTTVSTGGQGGGAGPGRGTGGTVIGGPDDGGASDAGDGGLAACASLPYTHVSGFGAIFDNWDIALNGTSSNLIPMPGVGPDGGFSGSTKELDPNDGSPTNGSVKLTVPFSSPNEMLLFAHLYNGGVNLLGATVTAKVKMDPGGVITGPTDSVQAYLVLKSTSGYVYAPGPEITLDPSVGWMTLSVSANSPSASVPTGYTPCDIREIDVVVQTGNSGMFRPGVIRIDTITLGAAGPEETDAGSASDANTSGGDGGGGQ